MTDMEFLKNMKKGDRLTVNNQILKIKKIDEFTDDLGDDWRLLYLEHGYKLQISKDKINFFRITELDFGDEFLETIKINKIERVEELNKVICVET
ncbi:MAG: hypothetical protein AABY07_06635 [Nanoarchaeota archaeon]